MNYPIETLMLGLSIPTAGYAAASENYGLLGGALFVGLLFGANMVAGISNQNKFRKRQTEISLKNQL